MEDILARQHQAIRDHYAAEIEQNQNRGYFNSMVGYGLMASVAVCIMHCYNSDTLLLSRTADVIFEGEICKER